VVEKYNRLDRLTGCSTDVQWYNMYGAPEFKNEKLLSNLKKGATAVAKAAQSTFSEEIDYTVSDVPFCFEIVRCVVWDYVLALWRSAFSAFQQDSVCDVMYSSWKNADSMNRKHRSVWAVFFMSPASWTDAHFPYAHSVLSPLETGVLQQRA
jgi:hypothetical protein